MFASAPVTPDHSALRRLLQIVQRPLAPSTATTRRFVAVVVSYTARVSGLTGLAITKLDVLDTFAEIQVATGYTIRGEHTDNVPDDMSLLEGAQPEFETNARAYLHRIEELTGAPIWYVSVGTEREQIIPAG